MSKSRSDEREPAAVILSEAKDLGAGLRPGSHPTFGAVILSEGRARTPNPVFGEAKRGPLVVVILSEDRA